MYWYMPQQYKVTAIKVDPETWKEVKILAIKKGKDVQEIMADALQLYLADQNCNVIVPMKKAA